MPVQVIANQVAVNFVEPFPGLLGETHVFDNIQVGNEQEYYARGKLNSKTEQDGHRNHESCLTQCLKCQRGKSSEYSEGGQQNGMKEPPADKQAAL